MTTWQIKKLGDENILKMTSGGTPSRSDSGFYNGDILWLKSGELNDSENIVDSEEKITEEAIKNSSAKIFPKGTVLFAMYGATAGKIGILAVEATTNQAVAGMITNEEVLYNRYLYYFLAYERTEIISRAWGGAQPNLSQTILKEIEIPLPSLDEQKKIVKMLDEKMGKIGEAKRLRVEALADTEKILPQTLHEIFAEGKKNGWEEKTIEDIFVFNYGKGLSRFERSVHGKYIAYGANGELGKTNQFLIEGESIIVGRKGSAGQITRVSGKFWPTDVTYYVIGGKNYDIDFAFYLFKYLNFTQYAKGVKPGINRNEIYSLKFNFPPLAEQQKIVTKLDALSEKVRTLRDLQTVQLADLKSLEKAYLREAFSKKLV